ADPYASQGTIVHSAPQRVVVLPLPMQGRPSDFSGAVGQFTLAAVADSQGLRTENAFSVRVAVTGTGDIALLQRPVLTIPWATVVNTSDSVMWDSTGTLMHGSKEFRWLVTPQSGGHLTIPQIRYSYFNPTTKTYATAATAAISLTIAGDSVAPSRPDSLSVTAFSRLIHTLRQHFALLLGVLVLAGVIMWGAVRRYRIHNA
ncbi:MAG TPA: BatD family protein, partial [Gemmatimonadaceae bacterium]|nr:BatD family protein [Gemmatimonadaceae bacterium]